MFVVLDLSYINIEIESDKEGPFNVEIKYLDICYESGIEERYASHKLPIFKTIKNYKI
jgi:hypothetical protein